MCSWLNGIFVLNNARKLVWLILDFGPGWIFEETSGWISNRHVRHWSCDWWQHEEGNCLNKSDLHYFTLFAVSHFLMVAGTVPLAIRQCQMAIADFVMLCQQAQKVLYCPSKQHQSAYYFNYTLLSLYYRFRRTLTTNSLWSIFLWRKSFSLLC